MDKIKVNKGQLEHIIVLLENDQHTLVEAQLWDSDAYKGNELFKKVCRDKIQYMKENNLSETDF